MSLTKFAQVIALMIIVPSAALAQSDLYGVDTTNTANAGSNSGGNSFDFSTNVPSGPAMAAFAGGPCTGAGTTASTSVAGLSVGAGRMALDDSCQRRNWVQTLLGASQHMTAEESRMMVRLAVEVMRDDPFLAGPMERVGIGSTNAKGFEKEVLNRQELTEARQEAKNAALAEQSAGAGNATSENTTVGLATRGKQLKFADTCVVAMNAAPNGVASFLQAKNCTIRPTEDAE